MLVETSASRLIDHPVIRLALARRMPPLLQKEGSLLLLEAGFTDLRGRSGKSTGRSKPLSNEGADNPPSTCVGQHANGRSDVVLLCRRLTMKDPATTKVPVSITERLIPSLAFGGSAITGAIGSILILQLLERMRIAQTAGLDSFFAATAQIEIAMGAMLSAAAAINGIGLLVSAIRMFTTNTRASPPGFLFLVMGLLSLLPPFLIHFILHLLEGTAMHPEEGGISAIATTLTALCYLAPALTVVAIFALIAFTFFPFNSRFGRKVSPTIFLFIVGFLILGLAGIFFWQARQAIEHTGARLLG